MKKYKAVLLSTLLSSLLWGCTAAGTENIETSESASAAPAAVSTAATASTPAATYAPDELHKAANQGDVEKVWAILSTKVDVDARDSFGGTALHAAMFQDNMDIVEKLINYGFDINAKGTSNGYTPLHDAVWADNLPAAKLLIDHGADPNITNNEGQTPADKAEEEGKQELYQYLSQFTSEK